MLQKLNICYNCGQWCTTNPAAFPMVKIPEKKKKTATQAKLFKCNDVSKTVNLRDRARLNSGLFPSDLCDIIFYHQSLTTVYEVWLGAPHPECRNCSSEGSFPQTSALSTHFYSWVHWQMCAAISNSQPFIWEDRSVLTRPLASQI